MKIDTETLIEYLEDAGYEPRCYSGRAMYGRRCVSVTVELREALRIGAALVLEAATAAMRTAGEPHWLGAVSDSIEAVAELMRHVREDNMGLDRVVYWPRVEWPAAKERS